jgi:hypothetical protein
MDSALRPDPLNGATQRPADDEHAAWKAAGLEQ